VFVTRQSITLLVYWWRWSCPC